MADVGTKSRNVKRKTRKLKREERTVGLLYLVCEVEGEKSATGGKRATWGWSIWFVWPISFIWSIRSVLLTGTANLLGDLKQPDGPEKPKEPVSMQGA